MTRAKIEGGYPHEGSTVYPVHYFKSAAGSWFCLALIEGGGEDKLTEIPLSWLYDWEITHLAIEAPQ